MTNQWERVARKLDVPVVVLNCKLGGLAIMRSLGTLGVRIFGVDGDPAAAALTSRYCRKSYIQALTDDNSPAYLELVLRIGKELGDRAILIPTSDELSVFVAAYATELREHYLFPENGLQLIKEIMSKDGMYGLARAHGVPTAATVFPKTLEDVVAYAGEASFPVMLKGILGNRLLERTGKKMVIVTTRDELIDQYRLLEDPECPNLMLQEYIPGEDDQIYIFNGYFNERSDCLAGFTGHKIRQYPVHVGCASLGICTWNQSVADITTIFMKALGYRGILDIGYRWDPRERSYKVLDINPRVGQAFRIFVSEDGMDVVRALYLDLLGHPVPRVAPCEGRRWVIEDYDLESSLDYYREGTLNVVQWLKSYKDVREGAWFSWKDPIPFLYMCWNLIKKAGRWAGKRTGLVKTSASA